MVRLVFKIHMFMAVASYLQPRYAREVQHCLQVPASCETHPDRALIRLVTKSQEYEAPDAGTSF
jgi:hypothetical protein